MARATARSAGSSTCPRTPSRPTPGGCSASWAPRTVPRRSRRVSAAASCSNTAILNAAILGSAPPPGTVSPDDAVVGAALDLVDGRQAPEEPSPDECPRERHGQGAGRPRRPASLVAAGRAVTALGPRPARRRTGRRLPSRPAARAVRARGGPADLPTDVLPPARRRAARRACRPRRRRGRAHHLVGAGRGTTGRARGLDAQLPTGATGRAGAHGHVLVARPDLVRGRGAP